MGKSKYPEKYDTSVEIPQVRGTIQEVGVDLLNSLRSAIFQIEHTLGLNPQGSSTSTVSDRLSKSLDYNGNIKKDALDKAGVIYGPIINENIAKTAGIDESKLKLDFPTQILQTEISLTISKIDYLVSQFEELSTKFSSHVYPDAKNRHTAGSISIEEITGIASDEGLTSISTGSVYQAIEDILTKHVKYSGVDISDTNNSHTSNQIYFDNATVSAYISSEDVQGAIEDLTIVAAGQQLDHQDRFHGNGYFNVSTLSPYSSTTEIISDLQVSFSASTYTNSERKTTLTLSTPQEISGVEVSDIVSLTLSNSSNLYVISDITYDTSDEIVSLTIFGSLDESSSSSSTISIYKREKRETTDWGLSATVLEYPDLLSAGIVQIANPDSPGIISIGITANSTNSTTAKEFTLEINGKSYTVNCYNASYSFQTLEATISAINESLLEQGAGALAYKVFSKKTGQYELAIVSNFYGEDKYIKISASDDSLTALKLSSYADREIYGTSGNYYIINGYIYSAVQPVMSLSGLTLDSGTNYVSGANFSDYQIKKGDILNIYGSDQDDGSYVITNVSSSAIYVNSSQLSGGTWLYSGSSTTTYSIYRNTISLDEYNFIKTSGSPNGALIELIIDNNSNLVFRTKLEYQMKFYSGDSLFGIIYADQYNSNITETLNFETDGVDVYCYLDTTDKIKITGYKNTNISLHSKQHNISLKLIIYNADDIYSYISTYGSFSSEITIYQKPDYHNIILIGTLSFSSANGRVEGGYFRLPYIYDLKDKGTIKLKDIGEEVKRELQSNVFMETRSSGVVNGLEIASASFTAGLNYMITVNPGVAYIAGKRFNFDIFYNFDTGILSTSFDKIILFINSEGILFADSADSATCNFHINSSDNIVLGTVEYNMVDTNIIDQRLFINDIDLKLLNSVTVSPVAGMGHFTSINKAIKYAKRFSQLYPEAGVPEIVLKAGTHKVEVDIPLNFASKTNADLIKYYDIYGLYLDFPVKITGEGDSTIVDIITGYTDYPMSGDDRSSDANNRGFIIINGAGSTVYSDFSTDVFNDGNITLNNFKLKNSTILYIDPKILNTTVYNINFHKLKIKDIYFDWSNLIFDTLTFADTYYFKNGYAIKPIISSGSSIDFVGNIDIHSCTFDTCYIDLSDSIYFLNLSIRNNYFFSQDKKTDSTAKSFLIKLSSDVIKNVFNAFNADIAANSSGASSTVDSFYSYLFSDYSGNLDIYPSSSFNQHIYTNDFTAVGDTSILGNGLTVYAPATFNNQVTINGSLTIGGSGSIDISGITTFNDTVNTETILPKVSATYNLGSSSLLWDNIYSKNITTDVSGSSNLLGNVTIGTNSSNTVTINGVTDFNGRISSNISPSASATYHLGSSSYLWSQGYFGELIVSTVNNLGVLAFTGITKVGYGIMIGADQDPVARIHIKQVTDSTTYTVGPGIRFESAGSSDYWDMYYATGDNLQFGYNNTTLGYVDSTGSDVPLNFTGQHKCCVEDQDNLELYKDMTGLIVVSTGKYLNTIEDKAKATINESLPVIKLSNKACQKNIFGVISDAEDVNEVTREYAVGAFVSVFEKKPSKDDTRVVINSVGEGGIWVIDQNGNFENGDYITTSDAPGYGMRQDDDILRNYTVAKITQDCNFLDLGDTVTKEVIFEGKKYIAAFVGCTYHCG